MEDSLTMIETYIRQLLEHYNKVIIPGFGAFIKNDQNFNALIFSELFRFNDGLLEQYVIENEGISNAQALKKIKDFVSSLKITISSGGQYTFPGLGSLAKDVNGKIFLLSQDEPLISNQINKKDSETIKVNASLINDSANHSNNIFEKKIVRIDQNNIQEKNETGELIREDTDIFDLLSDDPFVQDKKTFKWWLMGIVVVVLILASWLMFWGGMKEIKNLKDSIVLIFTSPASQENIKIEDTRHKTDTIERGSGKFVLAVVSEVKAEDSDDLGVLKTSISKPKILFNRGRINNYSRKLNSVSNVKKYYLVAGCFKNKIYADYYVKKLQRKGFSVQKLLKENDFYTISVGSYTSLEKAKKEQQTILRKKGTVCWIMHY